MIEVHEVNDIQALAGLRESWESLLAETPGAQFFQTLRWLEVYWRHYGPEQKLRVLVVESDGRPIGIMPLVVRCEPTKVGSLRFLTYPLDDWGSFYGPIGPDAETTLKHGLHLIRRTRRDWDVLELRWVDAEGVDGGRSETALREAGFPPIRSRRGETAIIDLAGTWESFLAARSSKWRNNLKRWQRRLEEQGDVRYLRHRPRGAAHGDADPRLDLLDPCIEIARKSWQGSSETGTTLSHESIQPFLRDLHVAAAAEGGLDMNLLYFNDRPMAFAYNYTYRGHVFGLRIGYDPEISRDGVGNIMYMHALRDSFQRNDHTYDMGPGSLECKRHLWSRVQPVYRYSFYRPTGIRAQLVRFKRLADGWLASRRAERKGAAPTLEQSS
ncbi:MAG: GNAT family N-acetyltransferase [Planctomycetia bacterium]|nr:GNAT family N-acetyltransferase [Planctomycetia bacterium]